MKLVVKDMNASDVGEIQLSESVFGLPARIDILQRAVEWQRAKKQAGTHKTKGISEISGTTAKPYRQKGTGRARQGSRRASQFVGGQTTFGPVVRSHSHKLTKKFRKLALRTALSVKFAEGKMLVIDSLDTESAKTRDLLASFKRLGVSDAVVISGQFNPDFVKSASNIPKIEVLPVEGLNVLSILKRDSLIVSRDAIDAIQQRVS